MPSPVRLAPGTFGFPGDVTSVFGRVGAVIAQANDYSFAQLSGKPTTLGGYGITNGVITTDPRLSDARDADHILTATAKPISTAADPNAGDIFAFVGGQWQPVTPANYQGVATNQPATTSTVGVMAGLPGTVTPTFSGRVLIACSGQVKNASASAGVAIQIRRSNVGNQAHPANGDAMLGTALGGIAGYLGGGFAAGQLVPFSLIAITTGLFIGQAFWLDVSLATVGAGSAQILQTAIAAMEF